MSVIKYSGINYSKSPVSGLGNVSEPRLLLQARRLCEIVCA